MQPLIQLTNNSHIAQSVPGAEAIQKLLWNLCTNSKAPVYIHILPEDKYKDYDRMVVSSIYLEEQTTQQVMLFLKPLHHSITFNLLKH